MPPTDSNRKRTPTRAVVLSLVLASASAWGGADAATATGVVFEDLDRDGVRDRGEPGIEGVAVSNGLDVVATDGAGRYALDVRDGTIVFVTKPAGWQVPRTADGRPRHFYVHEPEGTPASLGLRYPGIDPTGPLPASVNFPLTRVEEPERYTAIWFADPQPQTDAEVDYVRDDVVAELVGTEARFGVTVGDIMYDELSLFPRYNRIVGAIGIPWYNVPGNHELNFLAPDDRRSLETFKRYFGPPYYAFDYGRVHFVVLDDVDYLGTDAGDDDPHPKGKGRYEGRFGARQLEWLRNDLALVPEDRAIVLAMHIPLRAFNGPERAATRVADREAFFDVVETRAHLLVLNGHLHTAEHVYWGADDGFDGAEPLHQHTLATVSGSWWSGPFDDRGIPTTWQRDGTPNGYYVMEVDGTDVRLRFKGAGMPAETQMRIVVDETFHRGSEAALRDFREGELLDGRLSVDELPAAELVVNLFDGGERSTLTWRIGDGPERPMERVVRIDPFVAELYARHEATKKSFFAPEASSHLWAADLPDDLEPGVHVVTVRAVDDYGFEHVGRKVIEVRP